MQTFIKIGAVVFELSCGQTGRQTDRQTNKCRAKYNQYIITNIRNFYRRG